MSEVVGPGMVKPGEVRAIRELKRGVQAQVCLGASTALGSAVVTIDCTSPEVLEALESLRTAIRKDARAMLEGILADQKKWDQDKQEKTA